jgi:hypothetical protein
MEACWVQRKLDDALKIVPRRRRKSFATKNNHDTVSRQFIA